MSQIAESMSSAWPFGLVGRMKVSVVVPRADMTEQIVRRIALYRKYVETDA